MKKHRGSNASFAARRKGGVSRLAAGAVFFLALLAGAARAQMMASDIEALRREGVARGWTFTVGENPATFLPDSALCGLVEPDEWRAMAEFAPPAPLTTALPPVFDWRTSQGLTPIRNQEQCGSCWAFATVGVVESTIKIHDGVTTDLSEQWLVSCNNSGWSCDGGWFAYDYFHHATDPCGGMGAVLEADFPYTATDAQCQCPYPHSYLIDSWAYVGSSNDVPSVTAIKQAIMEHGPVGCAVYVGDALKAYTGGVFNANESGEINHAVVLVGWNDNQGANGVWFLRNSWGPWWGEDGYMRIEYGCSQIGYGANFVRYASTPTSFYRVTYKRGGKTSGAYTFTNDAIVIAPGGSDNDTLLIQKRSARASQAPPIPTVSSPTGLKKFYTEAPIGALSVGGPLGSLTARNCHVEDVVAGEIGSVKMTAKPNSSAQDAYLFTTISSNNLTPANGRRFATASISLSGVVLGNLSTPYQPVSVSVASKKYTVRGGSYVSAGGIGFGSIAGALGTVSAPLQGVVSRIQAAQTQRISVKGARIHVSDMVTTIPAQTASYYAAGATKKPANITATARVFTWKTGPAKQYYACPGDIAADGAIDVESPLLVSAGGGDLAAKKILAAGRIISLSATLSNYRTTSGTKSLGGLIGFRPAATLEPRFGQILDAPTTGVLAASGLRAQGAEKDAGIALVRGDLGVVGVFHAGAVRQGGVGVVPNCLGRIGLIATLSPGDRRLPAGWPAPAIIGEARVTSGSVPRFKGDIPHAGFQVLNCE